MPEAEEKLRYNPGPTYGWHMRDRMTSAALARLKDYPEWQALMDDLDEQVRRCFRVFLDPTVSPEDALAARAKGIHYSEEIMHFEEITTPEDVEEAVEAQVRRQWELMRLDLDKEQYVLDSQYALHRLIEPEELENNGGPA
jgi:hypothetical protein